MPKVPEDLNEKQGAGLGGMPFALVSVVTTVVSRTEEVTVDEPLAQRILAIIYHDPEVRCRYKESLTDWILDTQPRTAPLDTEALVQYLAAHQPDLLNRLKINVRLQEDLARTLKSLKRK